MNGVAIDFDQDILDTIFNFQIVEGEDKEGNDILKLWVGDGPLSGHVHKDTILADEPLALILRHFADIISTYE
jgi:hypothetical protein